MYHQAIFGGLAVYDIMRFQGEARLTSYFSDTQYNNLRDRLILAMIRKDVKIPERACSTSIEWKEKVECLLTCFEFY